MTETPTILTAPHAVAALLLGLTALLAIGVASGAFAALLGDRARRDWPKLPPAVRGLVALLGAVWLVLFLVTMAAAVRGTLGLVADPAAGGLGLGALLVGLLGAPFLVWTTLIRQTTLDFQKEGHITDRISKAVEQLGAEKTVKVPKEDGSGSVERTVPNIEVRIGAILSLERIAQDSTRLDGGRDHVRVMEILCAYVRENAPASTAKEMPQAAVDEGPPQLTAPLNRRPSKRSGLLRETTPARNRAWGLPKPRRDIALALEVIGRRSIEQKKTEARWGLSEDSSVDWPFLRDPPALPEAHLLDREGDEAVSLLNQMQDDLEKYFASTRFRGFFLDLSDCNLQGANFFRGDFSAANFNGSRLEGAVFRESRLVRAQFGWTRLDGSLFVHAIMPGAFLQNASIEGADFTGAMMQRARLAHIESSEGARFYDAIMNGASVYGGNLTRADFMFARLEFAEFNGTTLIDPDFSAAGLNCAGFERTLLKGAKMGEFTRLRRIRFNNSAFRGIDLSLARLPLEKYDFLFGDASNVFPDRIYPTHWPRWRLPDAAAEGGVSFDSEWARWDEAPARYVPPPPPG